MAVRTQRKTKPRRGAGGHNINGPQRDIIVIGASAGGIECVCKILEGLPGNFAASIFIVQHVGDSSLLPDIFGRCTRLPVRHPQDAQVIERSRVYVAPANHHLKLEDGRMRVEKGARENRHRPSVDVLFRSAARSYRNRVVAIVLSGALDDGASGAFVVKARGGIVIVQDPTEAAVPDMPRNTLRTVEVDYCKPAEAIAGLLKQLVTKNASNGAPRKRPRGGKRSDAVPEKTLTPIVCPECNGPVHFEPKANHYKCEVGHVYSLKTLSAAHTETLERVLWTAIRGLGERVTLHEHLAQQQTAANNHRMAERFRETAEAAERDAIILREILDHLD